MQTKVGSSLASSEVFVPSVPFELGSGGARTAAGPADKSQPLIPRMGTDFPCEQYLGSAAFTVRVICHSKVEGFGPSLGLTSQSTV